MGARPMGGRALVAGGKEDFEKELALESLDSNILDYCSLDPQVPLASARGECPQREAASAHRRSEAVLRRCNDRTRA